MRVIDMNTDYEIVKLALLKACKYLREAIGVKSIIPGMPKLPDNVDIDGMLWLQFFLDQASEELDNKDGEYS